MHVGYLVQLKVKSLCDESCVRYYSNSLLEVAVNQWFSKCGSQAPSSGTQRNHYIKQKIMLKQYILI